MAATIVHSRDGQLYRWLRPNQHNNAAGNTVLLRHLEKNRLNKKYCSSDSHGLALNKGFI